MGQLKITRTNMLNREFMSYAYTIERGDEKQELTVFSDDKESPSMYMNYFNYKKGGNIELNLTNKNKTLSILNNYNKMIIISNDEILDVQDYYDNDVKLYTSRIRKELGEYMILTEDGKHIKELFKKGILNDTIRVIYNYDELGRKISEVTYKNNMKYGNTQLYQYDEENRITRMIRKASKTVISDVSNEYSQIPDQIVINEFTKFFNRIGVDRNSLINELNNINISIYDDINKHDLRKIGVEE